MKTSAFILTCLLLQALQPAHAPKITQEMIAHYLAGHYDCGDADAIRFDNMEYFNFTWMQPTRQSQPGCLPLPGRN